MAQAKKTTKATKGKLSRDGITLRIWRFLHGHLKEGARLRKFQRPDVADQVVRPGEVRRAQRLPCKPLAHLLDIFSGALGSDRHGTHVVGLKGFGGALEMVLPERSPRGHVEDRLVHQEVRVRDG